MALINVLKIGADGLEAEHDPSADSINMLDYQLGGTSLSGTSGSTVLGDDDAVYTNFSPSGDNIRATFLAIDTAIGNALEDDCAEYTNGNAGAITKGQLVYISANDTVDLAQNDNSAKDDPIGLVKDASIAPAAAGKIQTDGLAQGVLTGATANDKYFMSDTPGALTTTVPTASGRNVVLVGYAKNATDLQMRMQNIGKRA